MLHFKPITIDSAEDLLPFAIAQYTQSCDYTPGNLIMWARFMDYKYAIWEKTLFISCKSQADLQSRAYLAPIGELPFESSIAILQQHCQERDEVLRLTAVPESFANDISAILPHYTAHTLENWSDYIYSASSLATLQGKALNKKRNRYNKFQAEYPNHSYSRCTESDIAEIIKFLVVERECQKNRDDNMRCYEQWQCIATVKNLKLYKQKAAILRVNGEIAAFTLGELFGETLYTHIEKAKRDIIGAGEAINRYFAADMLDEHPNLKYINREEDLGDPGLRQVKRAYNPLLMLHRYEMIPREHD